MRTIALSELLGTPVSDSTGHVSGKIREVALYPQEHAARVAVLVIKTKLGDRVLTPANISLIDDGVLHANHRVEDWSPLISSEGYLLLERDLLDQQIIDVHGRKVVRVNDVDLSVEDIGDVPTITISVVEVGPRGAVRRLLKGIVPRSAVEAL